MDIRPFLLNPDKALAEVTTKLAMAFHNPEDGQLLASMVIVEFKARQLRQQDPSKAGTIAGQLGLYADIEDPQQFLDILHQITVDSLEKIRQLHHVLKESLAQDNLSLVVYNEFKRAAETGDQEYLVKWRELILKNHRFTETVSRQDLEYILRFAELLCYLVKLRHIATAEIRIPADVTKSGES